MLHALELLPLPPSASSEWSQEFHSQNGCMNEPTLPPPPPPGGVRFHHLILRWEGKGVGQKGLELERVTSHNQLPPGGVGRFQSYGMK